VQTSIVLDIGANLGLSVLPMAAQGVTVIGFEPVKRNVVKLKQVLAVRRASPSLPPLSSPFRPPNDRWACVFCLG
jgi:hypothetical protein